MFIQTGKTPTDTSPYVILCESIVLFVSLMLTDGLLKYVMRPDSRARLHVVFGSRLFCLLLVVFAVVTAAGYALITHLDLIEASEAMDDQLEVIAAGLEASQDHQEYGETTTAIFQTIIYGKDGILVLLDDQGTVIASNDEAYTVGTVLKDGYGSPIMPVIEGIALGESMELVSNRELGIGNDGDASSLPFMSPGNALNYARVKQVDGYYLLQIRSHEIVFRDRIVALLVSVFIGGIALVLAFVFASRLLHVLVEQPLNSANETLAKITDGDLNQEVQLHSSRELASLATYINGAVASLKEYAAESERRIEQDLSTARDIQKSALPRMFPPFPGVDAFDIYASMTAAKYVGGDFYDLCNVDDHKLGFLIADVSGKGIPAALFMMRAKTHISTTMRSGVDLVQAVTQTNAFLCEDNDTFMFVTMWAAILDWDTGELTYVNAGHDIPLLRHDGQWRWLEDVGGPLLGAMDFSTYDCATVKLDHGDELYLYTDGVTEAMNPADQLFGKGRMVAFLQEHANMCPRELDDAMREEVAAWTDGADQSDDITMLTLEYKDALRSE